MPSSRHPSVRLALLAFALSTWVEGSTLLRRSVLIASASSLFPHDRDLPELEDDELEERDGAWWKAFVGWMQARGRRLSELERVAFGVVDLSTAFLILNGMHSKPLLPFLLTPLFGELPVPRPPSTLRAPRWRYILLTSFALTLAHSLVRALTSSVVLRLTRQPPLLPPGAQVVIKGADLPPSGSSNEATHEECLICSAPAASSSPLEAFCTTAPKLHPVHRGCFLRWRAAYAQTRAPELVRLHGQDEAGPTDREVRRALSILKAATPGEGAVTLQLRVVPCPPDLADGSSATGSELLLLPPAPYPANVHTHLATLLTSSPPCPGCRSSVLLHFVLLRSLGPQRRKSLAERLRREAIEWGKVVTGRAVLGQFIAQQGFVLAVMSMMQATAGVAGDVYVSAGL